MRRRARDGAVALGLLIAAAASAAPAVAHDAGGAGALAAEDEFIKGVFAPAFVPPAPGTYALPVVKRVPDVVLHDTAGRAVSTRALTAGKVAVVSFIYTACTDRLGCPLASRALREVQARLRAEGLARQAVLLSISVDPARDTPAQLGRYAQAYGADPALWRFATAPSPRALQRVLDGYGQDRAPIHDEHGRFTGRYRHVLKVFLVDRDAQVRNIYSAGFLVPEVVLNDVKTLLGEGGS